MKNQITKMNKWLVIGLLVGFALIGSGKAFGQDVTLVANTSNGATGLYGLSTGVSVTSGTGNSLVTISREATTINQKNQTPTAGCFGTTKVYLISSASGGQIRISLPNTGDYYLDKVEFLLSSNNTGSSLSGVCGHYKWIQSDGTTYSTDNSITGLTGYDQYTTICASPISATAVTGAKAIVFGRGTIGGTAVSGAEFRIWQIKVWIKQVISCTITPTIYSVGGGGSICSGSNTNVTLANSESGVTYQLYKDAVASGSTVSGTGSPLSWSVSTAGTYTVQTPAVGSYCATTMSNNVVVTINQPPTTSTNGGVQSIVDGNTTASLGGNTPSSGTGAWSITSGGTGTFSNASSGSSTFTPTGGVGDYVLTWTISNSPCTASTSSLTVHVASNSTPVISWTSGSTSQNISTGSAIGSIVYTWGGSATSASIVWSGSSETIPDGISATSDAGAKTLTISGTPTTAGTYNYSITSSDGGSSSSALTGSITVKLSTPDVTLGAATPTNQGFTAQWAAVTGRTTYTLKVYQSGIEVGAAQQTGLTGTSVAISGLSTNTSYTYTVTAIGDGNLVPNSNESAASGSVRTLNTAKAITSFSITGQVSSSITGTNITVVMPYETTVSNLTPTITHSGASISLTGVQDFTDPKEYTVTAEDGSNQAYTATVTFGSLSTDNFRSKADGFWNDATPGNVWESQTNGT